MVTTARKRNQVVVFRVIRTITYENQPACHHHGPACHHHGPACHHKAQIDIIIIITVAAVSVPSTDLKFSIGSILPVVKKFSRKADQFTIH